jgi:hypothetical protein
MQKLPAPLMPSQKRQMLRHKAAKTLWHHTGSAVPLPQIRGGTLKHKHYIIKFTCACGYESEFFSDMEKHFEKEKRN